MWLKQQGGSKRFLRFFKNTYFTGASEISKVIEHLLNNSRENWAIWLIQKARLSYIIEDSNGDILGYEHGILRYIITESVINNSFLTEEYKNGLYQRSSRVC